MKRIVLLPLFALAIAASAADYRVAGLRCEFGEDPLGIDTAKPRLSWRVEGDGRAQVQSAFRILVASSTNVLAEDKGDLWDSGHVASDETLHVAYAGAPLASSRQAFWKVQSFDAAGQTSAWSDVASWTMGVLSEADWQARWIGASSPTSQSLRLRREFESRPGLRRAVAHVCGLGHYEMMLNGQRVGADLLAPGWSKYDRTCLYDTYDVTGLFKPVTNAVGTNAVGLTLGNGMYNVPGGRYTKFTGTFGPLKAIAQIRLEYEDGTVDTIGTDGRWRVAPGPITFSCVYGGEDHDARLDSAGWDAAGFAAEGWTPAAEVAGPGGRLRGHCSAAAPLRSIEIVHPLSRTLVRSGVELYDLGQNASFMLHLRVRGPEGSVVRLIPAELRKPDGTVDRGSAGGGEAWWEYTLKGDPRGEEWSPKFFYQGCRYVQAEMFPAPDGERAPDILGLIGQVVHSSSPPVGYFTCSYDLFNRTRTLVRWAQRSNMMSVLTDCPHREKLGWLEQNFLNGPSLRYEFDLARLFTKNMNDIADSQLDSGLVPDIAPEYTVFNGGFRDSPEWGSACILVPWQQYEWEADVEILRRHYDVMKRYVTYLGTKAADDIVSHGLGDWYDLGPKPPGPAQLTPVALTATAFYYIDAKTVGRTAAVLGRTEDAKEYDALAERIRQAFNRKFFDAGKGSYATGSQCANAIPLVFDMAEPAARARVLEAIVNDVRSRGNALTAGDVGYRYLLRALADGGRSDVIFDMNSQSEKPGYGFILKQGATSLTEAWDARRSSSHNHFMLGHIMEWFYADLAGIRGDPDGPGFKRIILKPNPVGPVASARASYQSIRGRIESDWQHTGRKFHWTIVVPGNTTATVFIPTARAFPVSEGTRLADQAEGVKFLRYEGDRAVFEVGSGRYQFESRLEPGR